MSKGAIEDVTMQFVKTWNVHDMKALARLFGEDAEFVNVFGSWWTGRSTIEARHAEVHASVFRVSKLSPIEIRSKMLSPDIGHVHMRWRLSGIQSPTAADLPERIGVMLFVVTREKDQWRIAAAQNTDIPTSE